MTVRTPTRTQQHTSILLPVEVIAFRFRIIFPVFRRQCSSVDRVPFLFRAFSTLEKSASEEKGDAKVERKSNAVGPFNRSVCTDSS